MLGVGRQSWELGGTLRRDLNDGAGGGGFVVVLEVIANVTLLAITILDAKVLCSLVGGNKHRRRPDAMYAIRIDTNTPLTLTRHFFDVPIPRG